MQYVILIHISIDIVIKDNYLSIRLSKSMNYLYLCRCMQSYDRYYNNKVAL